LHLLCCICCLAFAVLHLLCCICCVASAALHLSSERWHIQNIPINPIIQIIQKD
jgi:hypothetical protein